MICQSGRLSLLEGNKGEGKYTFHLWNVDNIQSFIQSVRPPSTSNEYRFVLCRIFGLWETSNKQKLLDEVEMPRVTQ